MSPSRSAWPCRILKISSCFLSPLNPWTPRSLATWFSSVMVLSLSSDRFIFVPPAPPAAGATVAASGEDSGASSGGVLRLGFRCEMAILSGGCHWVPRANGSTSPLSHTGRKTVNRIFSRRAAERLGIRSEPHVDDGALPDLAEPLFEPHLELLAEQDVADLVARLCEPLAAQRFLRVELEKVVSHVRAERGRRLSRRQGEDGVLDVGGQLAALEGAERASVLAGTVLRELLGQLAEVAAGEDAPIHVLGTPLGLLPAVFAPIGIGYEQDVARLEVKNGLQLLPVLLEIAVDFLLGHGDPEVHPAPAHTLHHQLVADPLLDPL